MLGKEQQKDGENSIMSFIVFILKYTTFLPSLYIPGQDPSIPGFEAPRISRNSAQEMVRLSAQSTDRIYPQETYLVLISVRGLVDPMVIVPPEELSQ